MPIAPATIPGIHGYGLLSARPTFGQVGALYYATDTTTFYRDNGASWDTLTVSAGGVTLSTANNALSADVTMTTINTFYDGPTVSLAPGTWLVVGTVTLVDSASAAFFTAKLWDGVTVSSSGESVSANGTWPTTIALQGIVSPGTTTSYKVSAANGTNSSTGKIKAAAPTNGAGNNASSLWAVKIA